MAAVAASALLAACVAVEPPAPMPPVPQAMLPPVAAAPEPPAAPAPPPPPREPEVAVIVPPPAAAPSPPPVFKPTDLYGKHREDVVALFGGPDIARREPAAEVLLYEGDGCALFVFLYEPMGGGAQRVEYVELGPRTRDIARDQSCLTGLLQRVAGD